MSARFTDRVCIVTGGASGIGKATCQRFAEEGAHVAILDLNKDQGEELAQSLTKKYGKDSIFIRTDVGNQEEVKKAIDTVVGRWNRINIVVNNAALMKFAPVINMAEEDWDAVLRVNLRSVFLFCKYSLPHMREGAIVNVTSVHAHQTTPNCSPYAASKGAIEAFTRALSRELDPKKVRANCVAPGAVNTPMLWNNPDIKDGKEKIEGEVGEPEDLAAAICFVASDEARYVHGTTLVVDGGRLDIL